ncbi:PIR protein [Plasmodium vivax]|nr:PIR protein [Plasmodium vivax]
MIKFYKFFSTADPLCIYKAINDLNTANVYDSTSYDNKFIDCNNTSIQGNDNGVCQKFNKLISLLRHIDSCSETNKLFKNGVCEYLNFWLNQELKSNNKNASVLVKKYSENVKTENELCFNKKKLADKLHYIDDSNLKEMKLLNELYTYYYEIISKQTSDENSSCSEYSQNCARQYKIARYVCIDNNYGLYSALMDFKNTYEKLYEKDLNTGKCNSANIIKLPSEYDILRISLNGLNKLTLKTMMSAALLGPIIVFFLLLIYFFMFTPLGTYVCVKERRKKKVFGNRDDNMQETLSDLYHNGIRSANRKRLNISYNTS